MNPRIDLRHPIPPSPQLSKTLSPVYGGEGTGEGAFGSHAGEKPLTPTLSPAGRGSSTGQSLAPAYRGEGEGIDHRLHEACQQFEAVFLLQLWRAMQRTVPKQPQTLNYAEMFDLTFAEYLSQHGQFGIAEKLYEQLSMKRGEQP